MSNEFIAEFLANPWALATTAFVLGLLFGVLLRGAFDGDDDADDAEDSESADGESGDVKDTDANNDAVPRAVRFKKIDMLAGEVEALKALIDEQAKRDSETMTAMDDLDKAVAGVSKHLEKLMAEIDNPQPDKTKKETAKKTGA